MAVEETKEQQQIYNIFRNCIYGILLLELLVNMPIVFGDSISKFIYNLVYKMKFFNSVPFDKLMELVCVGITCLGTKAKKDLKFDLMKMVVYPICIGLSLIIFSIFIQKDMFLGTFCGFAGNRFIYGICSIVGIMLVHSGGDAVSRYYNMKLGDDRFNFENESFEQTEKEIDNDYSVNIPMIYYYKGRMHNGWINIINPFRATLVLGTPGSGKSFGIIDPFIRQHSAKGFTMMVYDYKFPTLAKELLYQYCKNKENKTLPENCGFYVVNFADVRYSNRINPIQRKYIPDLAAASETAATLLEALNKGGGDSKGGSDSFFKNASENFLAAIIYFFVNLHPTGFKRGKKLKHFVHYHRIVTPENVEEGDLQIVYRSWYDYTGIDDKGNIVLNFVNDKNVDMSVIDHETNIFVTLKGMTYVDQQSCNVAITDEWYEDDKGNKVEPDTITGEYSDMAHVLQFLNQSYDSIFRILMSEPNIAPLMAPFQSAWENKAMDQLEGMVGTLRVSAGRLATREAYWIFTGDDFDLKISDKEHPAYLVIANDPEKEQIIGSLNALILNRLVTRVNSKGNYPCSIIIDELPTLYFHKIDRLIGTARSNKVSVTLGFQEIPQLEDDYGKVGKDKIISTCGNIFMGAARAKETLDWAAELFGKVKQTKKSVSISDREVSTSINEEMGQLIPPSKLADMATGWLAGQTARDFTPTDKDATKSFNIENSTEFGTTKYFCKTNFDMKKISEEEKRYKNVPMIYDFGDDLQRDIILNRKFKNVDNDIKKLIKELLDE